MNISQDVRDFAAAQGVDEQTALSKDMEQQAEEFVKRGSQLYSRLKPLASEKSKEPHCGSFPLVSKLILISNGATAN